MIKRRAAKCGDGSRFLTDEFAHKDQVWGYGDRDIPKEDAIELAKMKWVFQPSTLQLQLHTKFCNLRLFNKFVLTSTFVQILRSFRLSFKLKLYSHFVSAMWSVRKCFFLYI